MFVPLKARDGDDIWINATRVDAIYGVMLKDIACVKVFMGGSVDPLIVKGTVEEVIVQLKQATLSPEQRAAVARAWAGI